MRLGPGLHAGGRNLNQSQLHKAESHCSDNENDNDHNAERTHSIPRRICTRSSNQWNAFSLRRYRFRSRYRCSGSEPLEINFTFKMYLVQCWMFIDSYHYQLGHVP